MRNLTFVILVQKEKPVLRRRPLGFKKTNVFLGKTKRVNKHRLWLQSPEIQKRQGVRDSLA